MNTTITEAQVKEARRNANRAWAAARLAANPKDETWVSHAALVAAALRADDAYRVAKKAYKAQNNR